LSVIQREHNVLEAGSLSVFGWKVLHLLT